MAWPLRTFRFFQSGWNVVVVSLTLILATACGSSVPATTALAPLVVKNLSLTGYTTTVASLNIQGQVNIADASDLTILTFYAEAECHTTALGQGLVKTFQDTGIALAVSSTVATDIYATTNSATDCYTVQTYTPQFSAPSAPSFGSTTPASPSRVSFVPTIFGTPATFTTNLQFFDDAACSHGVGAGTADAYATIGVALALTAETDNSIYVKAFEAFGRSGACFPLAHYVHDTTAPTTATFTGSDPASPTNSTVTPKVRGTLPTGAVSVDIFNSAACSTKLGSGTRAEFLAGVQVEVAPDATTTLWNIVYDAAGNASTCGFLASFINDTVKPGIPAYGSISPVSPTRTTIFPRVVGTATSDSVMVKLFSDQMCLTTIGFGSRTDFQTTGIIASATLNSTVSIYAEGVDQAGNGSVCTYLTDFTNDSIPPDPPIFSTTSPVSPTNGSITPKVIGGSTADTVSIDLYSNDQCTGATIGSGTSATFAGAGIQVSVLANHTTVIYAAAYDNVGNKSDCTLMTSYAHSNNPPPVPVFVSAAPASPSNLSTSPFILGTAASIVSQIKLYSNSGCTTLVGSGSKLAFTSSGLSVSLPSNTASSIYVVATDIYGNDCACSALTSYLHTDIKPSPPTFTSFTPTSPNNTSTAPLVIGTAPTNGLALIPSSTLSFYDSNLCSNRIGIGTKADFTGPGVMTNVAANSSTDIYAEAFDDAGNYSNCTLMGTYINDTIVPSKPNFLTATPGTPSYTQTTSLFGSIATKQKILPISAVNFYLDSACSTFLGTGSKAQYTSTGIPVIAPQNLTSTIYARTTDAIGNQSTCQSQLTFAHSDLGPLNPNVTLSANGALSFTWNPDTVADPTPTYTNPTNRRPRTASRQQRPD